LVLAPGTAESLFTPLKETWNWLLYRAQIKLYEQASPKGLGDAVLLAEPLVGDSPFSVLLPTTSCGSVPAAPLNPGAEKHDGGFQQAGQSPSFCSKIRFQVQVPHCGAAKIGTKKLFPVFSRSGSSWRSLNLGHPISRSEKTLAS